MGWRGASLHSKAPSIEVSVETKICLIVGGVGDSAGVFLAVIKQQRQKQHEVPTCTILKLIIIEKQ